MTDQNLEDHDRNEALAIALCLSPVLNEMWFLTIDPFVGISVFITKLSKRQCCWRILENFHSQEYVQFFDVNCGLFMRLHFSIGCYDYRRTTRLRQGIHFSITQVLFLLIMCINAPVQQILVPQVQDLMQASTSFPKVRRMLLFLAPSIFNTLLASLQGASRAPCSCHSSSAASCL